MAPQEKKWDAIAERDLLVSLVISQEDSGNKVRYNWPKAHEIMNSRGYAFTKDAMSQHFSKTIMKDFRAREPPTAPGEGGSDAADRTTPKKANRTPKATPASRKRAKAKVLDDLAMDDEIEEEEATPTKKAKKEGGTLKKEKKEGPGLGLGHQRRGTLAGSTDFLRWVEEGSVGNANEETSQAPI